MNTCKHPNNTRTHLTLPNNHEVVNRPYKNIYSKNSNAGPTKPPEKPQEEPLLSGGEPRPKDIQPASTQPPSPNQGKKRIADSHWDKAARELLAQGPASSPLARQKRQVMSAKHEPPGGKIEGKQSRSHSCVFCCVPSTVYTRVKQGRYRVQDDVYNVLFSVVLYEELRQEEKIES